jgi:hypothetical protein
MVRAKVENGAIIPDDVAAIDFLKTFEGKEVDITVKLWTGRRSQRQNRYWHGVVVPSVIDCLTENYGEIVMFHYKTITTGNNTHRIPRSTKNLKADEFARLIEKVNLWLTEHGRYLPEPWEN